MDTHDEGHIKLKVQKVFQEKKWKIFRLLMRPDQFPRFIPSVKQCVPVEKCADGFITAWKVEIDKLPLSWKEKDVIDFKNFSIRFEALEGDLAYYAGEWTLRDTPFGVEVVLDVEIGLGVPFIEKIVAGELAEKLKRNFQHMFNAVEERLTTQRYKNISYRNISKLKGFAVIGHPYNLQHLIRYFKHFNKDFKIPSQDFLVKLFETTPAYNAFNLECFQSKNGEKTHGYFVVCPIIPDMIHLSSEKVVEKVIQACKVSESLGVGIATLGGFTSIAGELYGKSLGSIVNVPVTTGNTFTVALVIDGIRAAARMMDIDLKRARMTVIGGTGDIGGACAKILGPEVAEVTITGRSEKNLMEAQRILSYSTKVEIQTSRDNNSAVRGADIVLAAASASATIIDFKNFKPGAIVCDVGYPKNISYTDCDRNDILIFSGGITSIPSEFNLGFDVGLPSTRVLYGCFAEAILLDFEERYENFSWGKGNITQEKVALIRSIGRKHGFELAPFFWGSRLVKPDDVEKIKEAVRTAHLRK